MNFPQAVIFCLKNYVTISGRAPRSQYWYFFLFTFVGNITCSFIDSLLFGEPTPEKPMGILTTIWVFGLLLPSVCVGIRRLHDTDKSAWWLLPLLIMSLLIGLGIRVLAIPVILYSLALFYFYVQKGTAGENRFGPDPLQAAPTAQPTAL